MTRPRRATRRWRRWPGGAGLQHRPRRHADPRSRGQSAAGSGARDRHCLGPRARRAVAPGARREPSARYCRIRRRQRLAARKQWMADHLQLRGSVPWDDGAVEAARRGQRACCRSASPRCGRLPPGRRDRRVCARAPESHAAEQLRGAEARLIVRNRRRSEFEAVLGYQAERRWCT